MFFASFFPQVNMLKERDKRYGAIKFVDISSKEYSSEENQGLDYETVCFSLSSSYVKQLFCTLS